MSGDAPDAMLSKDSLEQKKQIQEEGVWSHEARFQRMMGDYCSKLPTAAETTAAYHKAQHDYIKSHPDEEVKVMDKRPFTAGSLGRDKYGTGDFVAVSQF